MENEKRPLPGGNIDTYHRLSLSAVGRLLSLALPYRGLLVIAGVLMLFSTALSLCQPLIVKTGLERALQSHQVASLDKLALLLMALIISGSVIGYAVRIMLAYTGNSVVTELRSRLFQHLQRLPVAFFDKTRSGDLTSLLSNDVSLLQQSLTEDLVLFVSNVVMLVGGIVMAVVIDARLTGVVVGLMASITLLFMVMGRRLRKLTREQLDALSDTMGMMTESFSNIRLVKAFAREPYEDNRAAVKLKGVFRISMQASALEAAFGTIAFAGFILVLLGVLWYGGRNVMNGTLSAGSLFAFLMTVMIISGPMGTLAMQFSRLQRAIGASERLFGILDEDPEQPDSSTAHSFPAGDGLVEFDSVVFKYRPEITVLNRLSLCIPAGKVTALVGASGAGKTTLASLLYRFYEPESGEIRINGAPIRDIRREELREHIGLVPQEPILFNGTIRENIRYGKLDASDAEVESAARSANVEEFVLPLPEGYETMIGERGITLSGGQRQRVAIARAVLKDPRILLLDEATSALDNRSEALVREALDRLMKGRTTLVIAHRLSTIQSAFQIAVIEHGEVVELGTHSELLMQDGRYASLQNLVTA